MSVHKECEKHGLIEHHCTDHLLLRYKCLGCLEEETDETERKFNEKAKNK